MNRKQKAPWHRKQNNRRYHFRETWTKCSLSKSKIQYISMSSQADIYWLDLIKYIVLECFFTAFAQVEISTLSVQYQSCDVLKASFLSSFLYLQCCKLNTAKTANNKYWDEWARPIIIVTFVHNETRVQFGRQGLWTKVLITGLSKTCFLNNHLEQVYQEQLL